MWWDGGILACRTKPRELFTLSDKFLLPHSWGAVSRITHFECHMSGITAVCSAFFFSLVTVEICFLNGRKNKAHWAIWIRPVILTGTQTITPAHSTFWLFPGQVLCNIIKVDVLDLLAVSELMKTLCVTRWNRGNIKGPHSLVIIFHELVWIWELLCPFYVETTRNWPLLGENEQLCQKKSTFSSLFKVYFK